jgi:hypothetical protein
VGICFEGRTCLAIGENIENAPRARFHALVPFRQKEVWFYPFPRKEMYTLSRSLTLPPISLLLTIHSTIDILHKGSIRKPELLFEDTSQCQSAHGSDTETWAEARFPHASCHSPRECVYTIVESTTHCFTVDGVVFPDYSTVSTFVSDSNGASS